MISSKGRTVGQHDLSRDMFLMARGMLETAQSLTQLLRELERVLAEPQDDSPGFSLLQYSAYGYSTTVLDEPGYRFTRYYGCNYCPIEDVDEKEGRKLHVGRKFITLSAQFYHKSAISQAELWFAVCSLRKKPSNDNAPVWMLSTDRLKHWSSTELPEYGKWLDAGVVYRQDEDMIFSMSRQPLGIFKDRADVVQLLSTPLRERFRADL